MLQACEVKVPSHCTRPPPHPRLELGWEVVTTPAHFLPECSLWAALWGPQSGQGSGDRGGGLSCRRPDLMTSPVDSTETHCPPPPRVSALPGGWMWGREANMKTLPLWDGRSGEIKAFPL